MAKNVAHKNPLLASIVLAVLLIPALLMLTFQLYACGVHPQVASLVMIAIVLLVAHFGLPHYMKAWNKFFAASNEVENEEH